MRMQNPLLVESVEMLRRAAKQNNAAIWKRVAELLSRPRSMRAEVNISKIARYSSAGSVLVIPGKVLGSGSIEHPVTVAAFSFSSMAIRKITDANGRALSIDELVRMNPKGTGVRIVV